MNRPPEIPQERKSAERKPFALAASLLVFITVFLFYLKVVSVNGGVAAAEKANRITSS